MLIDSKDLAKVLYDESHAWGFIATQSDDELKRELALLISSALEDLAAKIKVMGDD